MTTPTTSTTMTPSENIEEKEEHFQAIIAGSSNILYANDNEHDDDNDGDDDHC